MKYTVVFEYGTKQGPADHQQFYHHIKSKKLGGFIEAITHCLKEYEGFTVNQIYVLPENGAIKYV
jgi:hypothetical protein